MTTKTTTPNPPRARQLVLPVAGAKGEEPLPTPNVHRLTPAQLAILRHVGCHGRIHSFEAGIIVHECSAAAHSALSRGGDALEFTLTARRRYAASDGSDACGRLVRRGLLEKIARGVYVSPNAPGALSGPLPETRT